MGKFGSKIALLSYFLRYVLSSRHRRGHGIHSPFVYDFVSKVLYDKSRYHEYGILSSIKKELRASRKIIRVEDQGVSSKQFKKISRTLPELLKISSIPEKYGRLLFRITRHYLPDTIIELGTSIGISAMYLAMGNPHANLLSVEGNPDLCMYAAEFFEKNGLQNIHVLCSDFDDALDSLPELFSRPKMVFIDGNHQYESTIRYFQYFIQRMNMGIIIIDDIYYSRGMQKAWKEIVTSSKESVTLDIFRMGIIIIRESITPGYYIVRF
jgi:predicted O-methyltransferase YrrM